MALFDCHVFSTTLKKAQPFRVLLPEEYFAPHSRAPYPVLYLLHGLSDDYTAWTRYTSIERYIREKNLAVVMPDGARSLYTNMVYGPAYWTYIAEELPRVVSRYFPVSSERKATYVAGLSMGGYGAFKLALNYPHRFAAAVSLSGVLDIAGFFSTCEEKIACLEEWRNIFGDIRKLKGSENDLITLLKKQASRSEVLPLLYACCGEQDNLLEGNLNFSQSAARMNVPLTYKTLPGDHNWDFWDKNFSLVLDWLGF